MNTLFVTSTAQTPANYYTIWHLFQNNTDINHIVIISTNHSKKSKWDDNLKVLLSNNTQLPEELQITELHLPNGIEENNLHEIEKLINAWIDDNKPKKVIFNITGGTKLGSVLKRLFCQGAYFYLNP